jgi:RHS repeat-associated protein
MLADMNGDGLTDIVGFGNSGVYIAFKAPSSFKLISVTDSFGNKTTIAYKSITDRSIYRKYNNSQYPDIDVQIPLQVVSTVSVPAPNGTRSTTSYRYEGLKTDLRGLGSLGFAKIISMNNTSKTKNIIEYYQEYPYNGFVKTEHTYIDDELIGLNTFKYNKIFHFGTYAIQLLIKVSKTYEDGDLLKTLIIDNRDFDEFGNIQTIITRTVDERTGEVFTQTVHNEYENDETNWILARLIRSTVTQEAYGDSITKTSSFTYDDRTGILISETIEPESDKWLKKVYSYNKYGNRIKEITTGADVQQRVTEYTYDKFGKFVIKVTNPLGQSEKKTYDSNGNLLSLTGPNNLTTRWNYDPFGKKIKEIRADGTSTVFHYAFDTSAPDSYYKITVKSDGISPVTTYYNRLGQKVRVEKIAFNAKKVYTDFYYNEFGNLVKQSTPYYAGETPEYILTTYDKYQRPIIINSPAPDGQRAVERVTYEGFTTIITNAKGQIKRTRKNVMGKIVEVVQEDGGSETYEYDASGNLIKTIDSKGNVIELKYDIFGHKIYQHDPDMGEWYYAYNSLGELIRQTDAKGQTIKYFYDSLGRKVEEQQGRIISKWQYDKTFIGKLYKESKSGFSKIYQYDRYGRVDCITTQIDGKRLTQRFSYDRYGRLESKTLPHGFKIKNVYNDYGYLEAIKSPRKQIKDFDPDHFVQLIDKTLVSAAAYYKKSLEYQYKARKLRYEARKYRWIALVKSFQKNYFLRVAKRLESYARHYEFYAMKYKRRSMYYKHLGDKYLKRSKRYRWFFRRVFRRISKRYYWYSRRIAYLAANYLKKSKMYRKKAIFYRARYKNVKKSYDAYLSLARKALADAKASAQVARNYMHKYEIGQVASKAYQTMLRDSNHVYFYKVLKTDAAGRITAYLSGNGLITEKKYDKASGVLERITTGYNFDNGIRDLKFEYDKLDNVTFRSDRKLNVVQLFRYDDLNRLVSAHIHTKRKSFDISYGYDTLGNMIYKSDVGTYSYDPVHPHRVIQAGTKRFRYDANGNMIDNAGIKISYTAFNKPDTIITKSDRIEFAYDSNKQRYKKETKFYTTYYLGKSYEEKIYKNGGNKERRYFIYADGKVISIYTDRYDDGVWVPTTKYLHYDSLNSVDTITTGLGVVEGRFAYKPFGEKLNLDKEGNPTTKAPFTNRGYTGHEHIEETHFIHMNARLYDPTIARFLSADTMIPYIYDSQSYNRYSYVRNNPLKYIDPTGHWGIKSIFKGIKNAVKSVGKFIKKNAKTIITVAAAATVTLVTGGLATPVLGAFWGSVAASAAGGFAAGVVGTKLYGGSWSQAFQNGLKGAVSGAIMGGIAGYYGNTWSFDRVVSTGVGGGVSSEIMGGKFQDGFKVAFITASAMYLYNNISSPKYNKTGKPHLWQKGKSDVGKQLTLKQLKRIANGEMEVPLSSDQSSFMKTVAKGPYMDAFAEFHDGLHDLSFMPKDQLSLIVTMPPSYALTVLAAVQPYSNTILIDRNIRKRYA